MEMSERRTQASRSAATRDALVAASRPLFGSYGYANVGTEQIVRAAGVTRGALYHHFADKAALFAAVFEAIEVELLGQIAAAAATDTDPDPVALMRAGAAAWLDACIDPEVQRIVLLDAPVVLGWEQWTEISTRYNMGLVHGLITQAIEAGRIASQPVAPLAHILLGAVREAALYLARADDQRQARAEVGAVLDRIIEGIATA
jgi:AcrR family transcriptional regulator